VPVIWMTTQPWFSLNHVWFLSVATVVLQTIVSFVLVQKQMRVRLSALAAAPAPA